MVWKFWTIRTISTHALREEGDQSYWEQVGEHYISTHALREEGDEAPAKSAGFPLLFLPTPSARRATFVPPAPPSRRRFLPTPSARRATGLCDEMTGYMWDISTNALREEGDLPYPAAS